MEKLNLERFKLDNIRKYRDIIMSTLITVYFIVFSFCPLLYCLFRYLNPSEILLPSWCNAMFYFTAAFIVLYVVLYLRDGKERTFKTFLTFLKENIPLILFFLYILWMWISTGVRGFSARNVWGSEKSRTGLISACCYLFYFLGGIFLTHKKEQNWVRACLVASGTICTLVIMVDYFFLESKWDTLDGSLFFYNRNDLSSWLMMICLTAGGMLLLEEKRIWKIVLSVVYFILVIGLILSDALGYLIGGALGLVFAFIILYLTKKEKKGKWKSILLVLLLTVGAYAFMHIPAIGGSRVQGVTSGNLSELSNGLSAIATGTDGKGILGILAKVDSARAKLWSTAITSIQENPLFGISKRDAVQILYENAGNGTVHNAYLSYAMDYGIPAAILAIAFIFSVYLRGAKHRKELGDTEIIGLVVAFGYCISIFTGYDIFYTTPFAMLALGLGYFRKRKEEEKDITNLLQNETSA